MSKQTANPALNAALAHHAAGRIADAARSYRQVLARDPGEAIALRGLALIAHAGGDNADAARLLSQAVERDSGNARYWFEFDVVLREAGKLDEAADAFTRAIALNPADAQSMADLRITFRRQHRADAAVDYFRKLTTIQPGNAAALNHLGQSLLHAGNMEEAIQALQLCLRIAPGHSQAFRGVADALIYQGRYTEAAQFAGTVAEANPALAEAWAYFGKALQRLGKAQTAEQCLRKAVALDPKLAPARNFLGVTLRDLDRIDEALAAFAEALSLRPDYADAYNNLGLAHSYAGQPAPALAAYRRAMQVDPDFAEVHGPYLMALNRTPGVDPREVFESYRDWARRFADPLTPADVAFPNDADPDRRLRIGYLSPDFRGHSVAYFIEPVLAAHDGAALEVFCYANVKAPDAVTERLRGYGHAWRDVVRQSDQQVADLIRQDRIDILVDLAGHTTDHRLLAAARRPAPVQVTWLGYPNTTGMRAIDYRLTDAIADPPGDTEHLHTEKLFRLGGCFLCYRPPEDAPPVDRAGDSPFTFASFNSFAKVTPEVLDVWARVLADAPESRLVIKSKGADADLPRRNVAAAMSARGVDPARVELLGTKATTAEHLGAYRRVDVALDTFPYNGTTTTCEALWMGVPVITLAGATHAARVGASLLTAAGLQERITTDADAYVRLASALAAEPARVSEIRRGTRERLRASPLLDARAFTARLEAAYRRMWRQWCANPAATVTSSP